MIIKDFYCSHCNSVTEDVWCETTEEVDIIAWCHTCNEETSHFSTCSGGIHSRWRFADFPDDPDFYKGQIRVKGMSATQSGKDVMRNDIPRLVEGTPERKEHHDKIEFNDRQKRGKVPLSFDQKVNKTK